MYVKYKNVTKKNVIFKYDFERFKSRLPTEN